MRCSVVPCSGASGAALVRRSLLFRVLMARTYVGVDLGCSATSGGGPKSAVAILDADGQLCREVKHFRQAKELIEAVSDLNRKSMIMAVDAPRSVPDHTVENYAYRSCEKAIKEIDPYAGTFSGAAALFIRWYEIETRYFRNVKVIETYPRVIWAHLKLPGKAKDFSRNRAAACRAVKRTTGITCDGFSHHQIDALLCAYTALCYDRGEVAWFGQGGEGLIMIPEPGTHSPVPQEAEQIDERHRRFPSMSGTCH